MTELTITHENITKYWHRSCPHVTKVRWGINKLSRTVLRNFPNLIEFDCTYMDLTHLRGIEVLTNLKVLKCSDNWLRSVKQIRGLNLRELYCSSNRLSEESDYPCDDAGDLDGIQTSTDLEILDCHNSKIGSLTHIRACSKLRELNCSDNRISDTETIMCFPLLSKLNCKDNCFEGKIKGTSELVELDCSRCCLDELDLTLCSKLRAIKCDRNKLSKIQGLSSCTALESLDCQFNQLTGFDMATPITLRQLVINSNWLVTLDFFRYVPNLTHLPCQYNRLTTLAGIEYCKGLVEINCSRNKLETIASLSACTHLQKLVCDSNNLTTLEPLAELRYLQHLDCSSNQLRTLDGIQTCTQLTILVCRNNHLVSIAPVSTLYRLTDFDCSSNHVESMEPLVYLQNLVRPNYNSNPLAIQSARFERFMETRRWGYIRKSSTVYSNTQSVHDEHIQKTVRTSLIALLSDPKPMFTTAELLAMIEASDLNTKAKELIARYCADKTIHSDHHISYEELLTYVWNRIIKSEYKVELVKILSQQICDSEGKCFTGRFNRTLSTLMGYYDDIVINISDASRISAIILLIKDRMAEYDPVLHSTIATIELQEAGYTLEEIQPWVGAIDA